MYAIEYYQSPVKVAYVDYDPVVISHARALLANGPGVIAVPGDLHDPASVLADSELLDLINLAEPTCVIFSAVLHFVPADIARDVATAFAKELAAGSYLIVSVGTGSPSENENFTSAYTAARIYIHDAEQIQTLIDDLELVPPGVVPVPSWAGDEPAVAYTPRTATFLGGVARKA